MCQELYFHFQSNEGGRAVTSADVCESYLNCNEKFIFASCSVLCDVSRSELFVLHSDRVSPAPSCFFSCTLTRSRGLSAQACHNFSFLLVFWSLASISFHAVYLTSLPRSEDFNLPLVFLVRAALGDFSSHCFPRRQACLGFRCRIDFPVGSAPLGPSVPA
jgi:hypothetical protein